MTVRVKQILGERHVAFKDGGSSTKTQFLTDDEQILEMWGKPTIGEEMEGEVVETQFGKEFKRARKAAGKGGRSGDPDTMIIAYAKDIVTAFVDNGSIKDMKEAAKQWENFTKVGFALYDKRKQVPASVASVKNTDEAPF